MTRIDRPRLALIVLGVLLALDILIRLGAAGPEAHAQTGPAREPVSLTAATTEGGNYLLYRMWSDGSIDVRLVNPLRTQAHDWPRSDKPGISFQEGWKAFQVGP